MRGTDRVVREGLALPVPSLTRVQDLVYPAAQTVRRRHDRREGQALTRVQGVVRPDVLEDEGHQRTDDRDLLPQTLRACPDVLPHRGLQRHAYLGAPEGYLDVPQLQELIEVADVLRDRCRLKRDPAQEQHEAFDHRVYLSRGTVEYVRWESKPLCEGEEGAYTSVVGVA